MNKFVFLILLAFLFSLSWVDKAQWSIRKDYECEIAEKSFFIKDCYRNGVLNLDDRKMIAQAPLSNQ